MATTVRDIMSTALITAEPSMPLIDAAVTMSSAGVGSVLVVEEGTLIGIFTERDIVSSLERSSADSAPSSPVSDAMTRNPTTIGADATVREAMAQMLGGGFRHLPVFDGEMLVGVVSMRDLAREISEG
jgi:CBS domain-containing protein